MKVRGDIVKTYQVLHTWTGIISGLVLFIGFYAGSLTMFKPAIERWSVPPSHHLESISEQRLDTLIAQAAAKHDKVRDNFIISFTGDESPMSWYEKGGDRELTLSRTMMHATLDADGELVTQLNPRNELGTLIDMLHRTAGIVGKVGHEDLGVVILGGAGVLYFLALVSGVIYLLPKLVKSFFALNQDRGPRRFWRDSHNLVSVVSLPFHLIIAWTVVVFAFHDVFYDGLTPIYDGKPLFSFGAPTEESYTIDQLVPLADLKVQIGTYAEGYDIRRMTFSGLETSRAMLLAEVVKENQMMNGVTSDYVFMNPFTGEVQFNTVYGEDDTYGPLVASFFSLHFGNFGDYWGRWLYFIMGLMGAFVFYSGNLLWLERRRVKQSTQNRSNRFMASLTVGVCCGSILGVVLTLVGTKWLYLITSDLNGYYLAIYYAVFFGTIIYSFVRGAARSAIHLQYLLSISCLCIPMTSLLALSLPTLGLWSSAELATIFVDITAFVFAGIFYLMARNTIHRAYNGDRNSIWAVARAKPETAEVYA